jgi:hypothetical protein
MRLECAAKTSSGCKLTQAPEEGLREFIVIFLKAEMVAWRGGVVASKSADIIGAKNREEKVELATVEEFIKNDGEGNRVDGDAGGRVKE